MQQLITTKHTKMLSISFNSGTLIKLDNLIMSKTTYIMATVVLSDDDLLPCRLVSKIGWNSFCSSIILFLIYFHTVLKYSGHAMWFGPVLGQHLWQLSRLAWKHMNVNATYLLSGPALSFKTKKNAYFLKFQFFLPRIEILQNFASNRRSSKTERAIFFAQLYASLSKIQYKTFNFFNNFQHISAGGIVQLCWNICRGLEFLTNRCSGRLFHESSW